MTGRRELKFKSVDDVLADVEMLAAAEREGKLTLLGNWTFGQLLGHLATWVDYSYDGAPLKVPAMVRYLLRLMKRRMLYRPMAPGRSIPRVEGGTLGREEISSEQGLERFGRAFERLKKEAPARPHLLFGTMTHEEWIQSHLRHAELHLSFACPAAK